MIRIVQVHRLNSVALSGPLDKCRDLPENTFPKIFFFIYHYLIIIYTIYSLSYWIPSLHKLLINRHKFHFFLCFVDRAS